MTYLGITCSGDVVTRNGVSVRLRASQMKLLSILLNWGETLCPCATLDRLLWGPRADQLINIHKRRRVHVTNLRGMLAPLGLAVEGVVNRGYRLRDLEEVNRAAKVRRSQDVQYSFRISAELKARAEQEAERLGMTDSDLMRKALCQLLGVSAPVVTLGGDRRSEDFRRGH